MIPFGFNTFILNASSLFISLNSFILCINGFHFPFSILYPIRSHNKGRQHNILFHDIKYDEHNI